MQNDTTKIVSPFDWSVGLREGKVCVLSTPVWESGPVTEHNFGEVGEVLEDFPTPEQFGWRHFHNGIVWDEKSRGTEAGLTALAEKRAKDEARNAEVCFLWLSNFGLRVKNDSKWRACSLNRVIHPQFGPAFTAATNGVDVLIVSSPSLGADWALVHRGNLIGPVTTAEVDVAEWDWVKNCPLFVFDQESPAERGQRLEKEAEERQRRYNDARAAVGKAAQPLPKLAVSRKATKKEEAPITAEMALAALEKLLKQ